MRFFVRKLAPHCNYFLIFFFCLLKDQLKTFHYRRLPSLDRARRTVCRLHARRRGVLWWWWRRRQKFHKRWQPLPTIFAAAHKTEPKPWLCKPGSVFIYYLQEPASIRKMWKRLNKPQSRFRKQKKRIKNHSKEQKRWAKCGGNSSKCAIMKMIIIIVVRAPSFFLFSFFSSFCAFCSGSRRQLSKNLLESYRHHPETIVRHVAGHSVFLKRT